VNRDPEYLRECQALARAVERFPHLAAMRSSPEWTDLERRLRCLLGRVQRYAPATPPAPSEQLDRVKAVHWNIEHGNWYDQVERALTTHPLLQSADLVLMNEVDFGAARAGNRDVAFDLARALGLHGCWAPLSIETTLGRDDDVKMAAGLKNQEGLFGLAILSRWPLGETRIVELPSPEKIQFDVERMYGRHIALIVEIMRPGAPFVAVSVHLEVHRSREDRARQMQTLMSALRRESSSQYQVVVVVVCLPDFSALEISPTCASACGTSRLTSVLLPMPLGPSTSVVLPSTSGASVARPAAGSAFSASSTTS